jgi:hypothetical protein
MADLLAVISEMLLEISTVYLVVDALGECIDLNKILEILIAIQ